MSVEIEYCPDCGWRHANVAGCWRRLRREAQEKLADPAFTGPLRDRLQSALDNLENDRQSLIAFFQTAALPDEEFERTVMATAAGMQQRAVDRNFDLLTRDWSPPLSEPVPMPGECHPAYRGLSWLADWVNGEGPYAGQPVVVVPKPSSLEVFIGPEETYPTQASAVEYHTLHRMRCGGPAPYVGQPFVYQWYAAADELGRMIAGETHIVHLWPHLDMGQW